MGQIGSSPKSTSRASDKTRQEHQVKEEETAMSFFVRGLVIGLAFAATIGPMSILCIQRTLRNGYFYGLISSLGVATADATYSSIAGFGLTVISNFLLSKQGTD